MVRNHRRSAAIVAVAAAGILSFGGVGTALAQDPAGSTAGSSGSTGDTGSFGSSGDSGSTGSGAGSAGTGSDTGSTGSGGDFNIRDAICASPILGPILTGSGFICGVTEP